ncbi:MAG: hypothetical protein AAGC76_05070 [Luteibacter sp.]|uniref:hypothetical protein n=1 Tax=Luteibacter sp. TaxID=1886636 RepID=UPI002808E758|nr:hypothetical protein [Luteibacter sp.]MDQ7995208.1 hypothetical protein [Luteibacter sp.]
MGEGSDLDGWGHVDQAILSLDDDVFARALDAVARYQRRQDYEEEPEGEHDSRGWWMPAPEEADVKRWARAPNRAFPHAYLVACRSLRHCDALAGADRPTTVLVKYWMRGLVERWGPHAPDPTAYRSALGLQWALDGDAEVQDRTPSVRRRPRL